VVAEKITDKRPVTHVDHSINVLFISLDCTQPSGSGGDVPTEIRLHHGKPLFFFE
jgi:hypothetical protein